MLSAACRVDLHGLDHLEVHLQAARLTGKVFAACDWQTLRSQQALEALRLLT